MAGSILTPATLWEKFHIDVVPEAELIEERKEGGLLISKIYIDGQLTKKGRVKVFAMVVRKPELTKMPAVVLVDGLKCDIEKDFKTAKILAEQGYLVLSVDIAGKWGDKERFTIYPEDVAYADYRNARGHLSEVKESADKTCWYEWGRSLRFALEYLRRQNGVSKVGIIGIKSGSTLVWQVAATEKDIACAVAVMGAGWSIYKGISKFSDDLEPQFSDEALKYVAGIEAQSYAKLVQCPMLTLMATNNRSYDADRAYDSVARIDNQVYKALDYSPNYVTGIDYKGQTNLLIFLDKYLKADKAISLPLEPEVKCEIADGTLLFTACLDAKKLKNVCAYVSEGEYQACKRSWKKIKAKEKKVIGKKTEEHYFQYSPANDAKIVCFFARAEYEDGFTISSNIVAKRFKEKEVLATKKPGILYSGRDQLGESIFCPFEFAMDRNSDFISNSEDVEIKIKSGPMGIHGVSASSGLFTFRINSSGITPLDDSILMLDVYSKEEGILSVKLFADFFGNRTEYISNVKLFGGRVWQNVKIEMNKFKTAEGRNLKNFDNLEAIGFYAEGNFILNNVLLI